MPNACTRTRMIFWLLLACQSFCTLPVAQNSFRYNLDFPEKTFVLPEVLLEISGLALLPNDTHLVAVQDENGIVFFIDKKTGAVTRQISFWKDGDYEGIAVVDEDIFIVKSTGTIYHLASNNGRYDGEVEKYNFFLTAENDVEGLAYDAAHHRLLLACKANAGNQEELEQARAIYAFNLATKQLEPEPAYVIRLEEVADFLRQSNPLLTNEKLLARFTEDAEEFGFAPSGIAIHPHTGQLYILSSVGKSMLIINPDGSIAHFIKLQKKIHRQPEGICFDRNGVLYISNEGKGKDPGKIHVFKMR